METLEIAQNEHSLFVHVNKISAGNRKIDELLGYLQNLFLDDSHIPSVSSEEQADIEEIFARKSSDDREIVRVENINHRAVVSKHDLFN